MCDFTAIDEAEKSSIQLDEPTLERGRTQKLYEIWGRTNDG